MDFRFNTHIYFPESGSRKRFQGSGMRAIDSPHKITPRRSLVNKISTRFYVGLPLKNKYAVVKKKPFEVLVISKTEQKQHRYKGKNNKTQTNLDPSTSGFPASIL